MKDVRLAAVHVAVEDVEAAAAFLATVCGSSTDLVDGQRWVGLGDACIIVESVGSDGRKGIVGVSIDGVGSVSGSGTAVINNLQVRTSAESASPQIWEADLFLDHVAIVVDDLDASAQQWETATGVAPEMIGIHPVSNGTLKAARLAVGDRMIELLSPVPGTESAMGARLEKLGEGPMALAMPAVDIDAKRGVLEAEGVRLLWQDPHWLVHPANPAGVLVQLTPRVRH